MRVKRSAEEISRRLQGARCRQARPLGDANTIVDAATAAAAQRLLALEVRFNVPGPPNAIAAHLARPSGDLDLALKLGFRLLRLFRANPAGVKDLAPLRQRFPKAWFKPTGEVGPSSRK